MATAVIGLIGALLGAGVTLVGALVPGRLKAAG
jgi:hypothetical protein